MTARSIFSAVLFAVCSSAFSQDNAASPVPPGLYVRNGTLMRAGKPYRGMGINFFQAFNVLLKHPENRDFVEGFRVLRDDYDIPFVRFAASPFGYKDWQLYDRNPLEYFRRMDLVVAEAEKTGLGLIPSLFWTTMSVPDYVGEPISAVGDPNSKSRAFLRRYATDVTTRYKDSPAVWGWEIGNEYMLSADLPKLNHLPPPKLGTKQPRTTADKLTREAVLSLYNDLFQTIRKVDPHRIIVSGDSLTRGAAWHNHYKDAWGSDSPAEWTEIFNMDTPDAFEVVSVHLYPEMDGGYFKDPRMPSQKAVGVPLEEVFQLAVGEAHKRGKAVWCGEFGSEGSSPEAEAMIRRMIQIILDNKIELSAPWNFVAAGKFQDGDGGGNDISPGNPRAYILDTVRTVNQQLAKVSGKTEPSSAR